ncbi:MAG: hypothetical protein BIFFINMI_04081 [Phycisphaerae bacterium]|nr:hypothetical protein [Phycisphaerae bacterium]
MIRRAVMPDWWDWKLELIQHLSYRMTDRRFDEIAVRTMMEQKAGIRPDEDEPGRWIVDARWEGHDWEIVVEPDHQRRILVVVTAYKVE